MTVRKHISVGIYLAFLICTSSGLGQTYTNTSAVLDAAGDRSSGGAYSNVSAIAQSGGIALSTGGEYVNYAGFLGTFSLQPGKDTDSDGLEDEVDRDNDGDGLGDALEVNGTAFDPRSPTDVNAADSDLDGMRDRDEATAGTDPWDDSAHLRVTGLETEGTDGEVSWVARGGKTYGILAADEVTQLQGSVLASNVPATGGTAPWYVVTNTHVHTVTSTNRFLAVRVEP